MNIVAEIALVLLIAVSPVAAERAVLVEAEAFDDLGGWSLDTQFMDQMGSPFLLAHGLGEPVADAATKVALPAAGSYRVWVRTRDWVAPWKAPEGPGRFQVLVDGKVVTEEKFPVGLMDVISVPANGKHYRMLLDDRGKFILVEITEDRAKWKLCRIENKTYVSGGRLQLNLHDGRNVLVESDSYKTGDVLKIEVPSQKILEAFKLVQGNVAMIVSGSNAGQINVVEEQIEERSTAPNLVRFKNGKLTVKDNVFVIGNKTPEVILPEVRAA